MVYDLCKQGHYEVLIVLIEFRREAVGSRALTRSRRANGLRDVFLSNRGIRFSGYVRGYRLGFLLRIFSSLLDSWSSVSFVLYSHW